MNKKIGKLSKGLFALLFFSFMTDCVFAAGYWKQIHSQQWRLRRDKSIERAITKTKGSKWRITIKAPGNVSYDAFVLDEYELKTYLRVLKGHYGPFYPVVSELRRYGSTTMYFTADHNRTYHLVIDNTDIPKSGAHYKGSFYADVTIAFYKTATSKTETGKKTGTTETSADAAYSRWRADTSVDVEYMKRRFDDAFQGKASAQYSIARDFEMGFSGVPRDYDKAARWHRRAAMQGECASQTSLGMLYLEGHGVSKDLVKAYMWTGLSAKNAFLEKQRMVDKAFLETIALDMTPAQIEEAKSLVKKWKPEKPQVIDRFKSVRIKFFEGGVNRPSKRQYAYRFPKSKTRYVWCEARVKNPLYKMWDYEYKVVWKYYNPDGTIRGVPEKNWNLKSTKRYDSISRGLGRGKPGNWSLGTYRVEVWVDGKKIGQKKFSIHDATKKSPFVLATGKNYDKEVLRSKLPVLIFFNFEDKACGYCGEAEPVVDALVGKYAGKIKFVKITGFAYKTGKNKDTEFMEFFSTFLKKGIVGAPAYGYVKNGKWLGKDLGNLDEEKLSKSIEKYLLSR